MTKLPLRITITWLASITTAICAAPDELSPTVITGKSDPEGIRAEGNFTIPLAGGRGFLDVLPGMPNVQQGSPNTTPFSVRGLGQDNVIYSVGTESNNLVNFNIGGVPASGSRLNGAAPLLWDVGDISVTRGPVLFGKGSAVMGGELRLEPNTPQFTNSGKATAELADYGSWRTGITENLVLIPEKLALRLNAASEGSDGAVTNLYDGNRNFAETERDLFRGQLRWRPAGDDKAVFDLRVDVDRGRGNPFGQAFSIAGQDVYDRYVNVSTTTSLPADVFAAVLHGRVDLDDGWWIESEASFQTLDGSHYTDFDGSTLLDWFYIYTSDERRFTGSTRFGRDLENFKWTGGIYAESSRYGIDFKGRGLFPIPQGSSFMTGAEEEVGIAAAFGHAELALGNDFWLTGGLRLDYQSRDQTSGGELRGIPRGGNKIEYSNAEWLPEIGTEWRGKDTTAGVKISRSYRPGGAAFAPSLALSSPYGPERGWEANLFVEKKWEKLRAEARVFHAWLDNQQVPYVPTGGFPVVDSFIANSGESTRSGAELEMVWQQGSFSAGMTAGYLNAKFDELVVNGVNRSGQAFPVAPEWSAGIGMAWSPRTGVFGEISCNWSDSSYSQIDAPQSTKLESRLILSARTGYRWEKVEAYVFGSNLLDEEYALSKSDYRGLGLPVSAKLGMPCVIGTGLTLKW